MKTSRYPLMAAVKILALSLSLLSASICAMPLSINEDDYYQNNIGNNTVVAKNLTGTNSADDSIQLNKLITQLSKAGGGTLLINKVPTEPYIYIRDIELKSKVHIKVASDVVFRPSVHSLKGKKPSKNIVMMHLGRNEKIQDVAITSANENSTDASQWFTVELTGGFTSRVKFVDAISVYNFKISGIRFVDSNTVFSNLEFNLNKQGQGRGQGELPTKGLVKNIRSEHNHVGYGVVQIRAGKHILFQHLNGAGGVTLRLETGFAQKINDPAATIDQVVGRDITIRDGNAAVNLSPHRVIQGIIDVRDIYAYNSANAVKIAAGFPDKKGGIDTLGSYHKDSVIADIKVVKGGNTAQIKDKDFVFYSCEQQQAMKLISNSNPDNESAPGQSIAVVRDSANPDFACPAKATGNKARGCYRINLTLPEDEKVSGTLFDKKKIAYYYQDAKKCS